MPESESTGVEQSEKEQHGIALAQEIVQLKKFAQSQEDYQAINQKYDELWALFGATSTEARLSAELSEAKEIFGEDFIGPTEVAHAFDVDPESIEAVMPKIPFSREELERAKELGQMLILRQNFPMKELFERLTSKFEAEGKGKVLYDTSWYKDEAFFTENIEAGWALVSKELVPESTSKNYLEQTQILVNYLKNEVFKDKTVPSEYVEAIAEFDREKAAIGVIVGSSDETEWKRAAEILSNLKITQLLRQSPAESLYDLILYFQTTGKRLLPDKYTWTSRRGSDGRFVSVGYFESDGVSVSGDGPGYSYGLLGVSFSRSR